MELINVNLIQPHPKNPRTNLGDLTELAESIRLNGIFQNLTVVPNQENNGYTVVIGHRRLAAAKIAGLNEVPCIIELMDDKKQSAVMLLENMLRNDLTAYEQAKGIQMCLDLGMNTNELSEKTGFKKGTIKHRLNMLKLNQEQVEKSVTKGATIEDFIILEQIKSMERKNEVLKYIGTNEFEYKFNQAINSEKLEKKLAEIKKVLKTFATQVKTNTNGYVNVRSYNHRTDTKNIEIPEDKNLRKYEFTINSYGYAYLYAEPSNEDIAEKNNSIDLAKQKHERREKLEEVFSNAYSTRLMFMKEFLKSKKHNKDSSIIKHSCLLFQHSRNWRYKGIDRLVFQKVNGGKELLEDDSTVDIKEMLKDASINTLAKFVYSMYETTDCLETVKYDLSFDEDDKSLKELYEFLAELGYVISDEEERLVNGSHEYYIKREE